MWTQAINSFLIACATVGLYYTFIDARSTPRDVGREEILLIAIHNKLDAIAHDLGSDKNREDIWPRQ